MIALSVTFGQSEVLFLLNVWVPARRFEHWNSRVGVSEVLKTAYDAYQSVCS